MHFTINAINTTSTCIISETILCMRVVFYHFAYCVRPAHESWIVFIFSISPKSGVCPSRNPVEINLHGLRVKLDEMQFYELCEEKIITRDGDCQEIS